MSENVQEIFTLSICGILSKILEIYWKLAKSPGNFPADSKFLYSQCILHILQ